MPEISVLVPSYDHAAFVERALRSIFAQDAPIKKLVVIDDGSTDNSAEVIRSVLRDCTIDHEFIVRENRGLCATLNEGLAMTGSEYFAYLGSDDVWLPDMLAEQIALLERRPNAVLAFSHGYIIDEDDNIIDRTDNWTDYADGDMLPTLLAGQIFPSAGVVYRRAALAKYGWNEDARLEDYELYLKLTAEGEFARNEKLLCGWRIHGRNTSADHIRMVEEQLAAQDRIVSSAGIDDARLSDIQGRYKFGAVRALVRTGERDVAWRWFRENLASSPSIMGSIGTLARLLVPPFMFRWNMRRKRRQAIRKYGKIDLSR